ncbi:MAG: 2-dehydropantoate 2-reductase N-terminal domain-containing protein, partial [Kineosporiaceae bacterium]
MLTAVVGAGGVGGLLAALLHRAGADVVLVVTSRSRQLLAEGGLRVDSDLFGRWVSRPPLSLQVPSGAAVLLAVKAPHLAQVVPGVVAAGPSQVVTLQNGIEHVARLRGAMPHTPITPAAIYVETRRIDDPVRLPPVTIEHRSPFLRLHLPAGDEHGFAGPLRAAGAEVRYAGAEDAVLWDKFALLAPMALLTAYHRAPLGAALARDP